MSQTILNNIFLQHTYQNENLLLLLLGNQKISLFVGGMLICQLSMQQMAA